MNSKMIVKLFIEYRKIKYNSLELIILNITLILNKHFLILSVKDNLSLIDIEYLLPF